MARVERYVTRTAAGGGAGTSGDPWTLSEAMANAAAGDTINIHHDGTAYSLAEDFNFITAGTATNPILWRGYKTTIGDGFLGFGTDGRLVTTNMPQIGFTTSAYSATIDQAYNHFQSLRIESSRTSSALNFNSNGSSAIACKIVNTAANASGHAIGAFNNFTRAIFCDADQTGATGGAAALYANGADIFYGCRAESLSGPAARSAYSYGMPAWFHCLLVNSVKGFEMVATLAGGFSNIVGCTIQGNSGNGIDIAAAAIGGVFIHNNMITDNGGYAIDTNGAACVVQAGGNRYRDNTSGDYNATSDWLSLDFNPTTTDTGGEETDYEDAPGGNFSLIYGSPGEAGSARGLNIGACSTVPVDPSAGGGIKGYASA